MPAVGQRPERAVRALSGAARGAGPEEHRASEVRTRSLDEADEVYDPAELAEVDDEL